MKILKNIDDVMNVAYQTRSMKTRIEKLRRSGYLVMVNEYWDGCYKYGDRTPDFDNIENFRFGFATRYTSLGLLGRTFGNAWYIKVSRNKGNYRDFPWKTRTVFVVIPEQNLQKLMRNMKLQNFESQIV